VCIRCLMFVLYLIQKAQSFRWTVLKIMLVLSLSLSSILLALSCLHSLSHLFHIPLSPLFTRFCAHQSFPRVSHLLCLTSFSSSPSVSFSNLPFFLRLRLQLLSSLSTSVCVCVCVCVQMGVFLCSWEAL